MQYELARKIRDQLQLAVASSDCEMMLVHEIPLKLSQGAFCIFLPESEAPFLSGIQEAEFACL